MTTREQLEAAITLADQTLDGLQDKVKDWKRKSVKDFRLGLIHGHAFVGLTHMCQELMAYEALLDIAQQARDQLAAQRDAYDSGRLDGKTNQ